MEFILISDNKIKIMLTEEDLREFELEPDELDYSNTETKKMFWDILSRAKRITGFDTDSQRVLVQLYPSRHGGCEMFVTKLGAGGSAEESDHRNGKVSPIISEKIVVKGKSRSSQKDKQILSAFSFESLDAMLSVCRQLSLIGYCGKSSAYIGDEGRCYLLLEGIDLTGYSPIDKFSFIYEFGDPESIEAASFFLGERAKPLCSEKAVELLCKC